MTARHVYRALLWICPADLRKEFGKEMEQQFLAELAGQRGLGRVRLWSRAVADALRHGLGARRDRWNRQRGTSAYVEYEKGRWTMDTVRYDVRHALRAMARSPGTTAIILITLALAIGANTAVFSAVNAVLMQPLPYDAPSRLVAVWEKRAAEGVMKNSVSPADYLDWVARQTSFSAIAAYSDASADLTSDGDPERIPIGGVTAAFFEVFRVRPFLGRTFAEGDDVLGQHRVVVLSHALWRQRYGADPNVVGQTIMLNGLPQQVIGVLPADAKLPDGVAMGGVGSGEAVQLFAPMTLLGGPDAPSRTSHQFIVFARLRDDVSLEQARAEMDRIGRDLEAQYPNLSRGHGSHVTLLTDDIVGPVQRTLLVLLASVGAVLLIACINVTNLLLARAAGRRREMAVRLAIGAGRSRLVRQILAECLVLAGGGALLGLIVAMWGVQLLAVQTPALLRPDVESVFSLPVLAFTAGVCLVVTAIAAALPAWHMVREDPADPLKEGGRSPVSLRKGLRFTLIVTEVALTSLLLIGAGLTLRSFKTVVDQDPGLELSQRLTFRVALSGARYREISAQARFFSELESRLSSEPTVRRVGATTLPPLTGLDGRRGVVIEGREVTPEMGPTRAHPRSVTANYLQAIGAHVAHGRGFLPTDIQTAPMVAIVNDTMARRYWPGQSPLGRRVRFTDQDTWREVVGVVADVKHWGLDADVNPEIYVPLTQFSSSSLTFVLATDGNPVALVPIVQRHVHDLDANLPLFQVRTMEEIAARSVERRRWTMTLLASFAVLALVLAAAGIYGVMAHLVSLRTPEIGVRLTLGARPFAVMRQIYGEALLQTGMGLSIGLGASLALMQGLRTILFGVEPNDPITLAIVAVSLLLVAGLSVAVPARRAMKVDPVVALRSN